MSERMTCSWRKGQPLQPPEDTFLGPLSQRQCGGGRSRCRGGRGGGGGGRGGRGGDAGRGRGGCQETARSGHQQGTMQQEQEQRQSQHQQTFIEGVDVIQDNKDEQDDLYPTFNHKIQVHKWATEANIDNKIHNSSHPMNRGGQGTMQQEQAQ